MDGHWFVLLPSTHGPNSVEYTLRTDYLIAADGHSSPIRDGITDKAVADALKRLERNGLIRRDVLPTTPVGVEYTITSLGRSLHQPFAALYNCALTYGPELERAQAEFDRARD